MLQVLPATSADVPRIARIFYDAFARTTIYLTIFADVTPEDQIACNELRLYKEVEDPTRQVLKAVVGDEIVAFAVWSIPHEKIAQPEVDQATKEEQERQRFPKGTNLELARRFFAQGRLGVEGLHYHLNLLGTDPRSQRTGAATALLRWTHERADKDGFDCYLKASPEGLSVYRRAQYEPFKDPIISPDDPSIVLYPMRRRPQSQAAA
ncbi:hypothetical protein Rhopal_007830-T1 [Rhodotorula paludigena]|uniref:N-acetyltransferase domain-containing protein n=1 Tax=Rhodotorula paludigena TaxID=86838 RepID=A0AAV5GWS1_9BASI|nr:hypothetical protein Rhopal_007830-T1 [Rhodotorula paludigena]